MSQTTPRRTKHDERREATRGQLIRLGLERLPVRGYAATSVRDIVAGSGLTKGAFEYHYSSKAEFFLDVLEQRAGLRGAWARLATEQPSATLEEAIAFVLGAFGSEEGPRGDWTLALGDFVRTDGSLPQHRERLQQLYAFWQGEMAAWVRVVQAQGLARTDVPAEQLATAIFAAVEGHVVHMAIYDRAQETVLFSIAAILAPPASAPSPAH